MLIAEDNPINQKLALSFIGKLGHSADLAGNGAEALNRLQTARYDVILMDLQMPEMDGVEAVQAIRQAERRQPAGEPTQRIIAMTAHAMKGDREKCLQLGFDGYIAKPILLEKLAEEITQVVAAPVLAFDYPLALAQLDNDPALFNELAAMFIDELPWSVEYLASGDRRSDMRRDQTLRASPQRRNAALCRLAADTLFASH